MSIFPRKIGRQQRAAHIAACQPSAQLRSRSSLEMEPCPPMCQNPAQSLLTIYITCLVPAGIRAGGIMLYSVDLRDLIWGELGQSPFW